MGNARYAARSSIQSLVCPHCHAEHPDDWECLEFDQLSEMRCRDCGQMFTFYLGQCLACAEESFSIWATKPSPYWRALLVCQFCGEPSHDFTEKSIDSPHAR